MERRHGQGGVLQDRNRRDHGQNDLWYDDCGPSSSGIAINGNGGAGSLPFAGVVSTPVVDAATAIPDTSPTLYGVVFLTSLCRYTTTDTSRWYLHELDLTNDLQEVAGSNSPVQTTGYATNNSSLQFAPGSVLQRSALLEVKNSNATPSNAIYVAFGAAVNENSSDYPYTGWLFAYSTSGSQINTTPDFIFSTNPTATASGTSGCYYPGPTGYQNVPNWCGHGAGIWMSSRGPAAGPVSGTTNSNVFLGAANGGFEADVDWGSSVLGFSYSASGGVGSSPSQSFTPNSGLFSNELLDYPVTKCSTGSDTSCSYSFESLNQNDWDMSASGVLLFTDSNSHNWLLTIDKGGMAYFLNQSSLGGFTSGDTGNAFPFAAPNLPCWQSGHSNAGACHRITSMAFYDNNLYYWPYQELLTGLTYLPNPSSSPQTGTGTVTWNSGTNTISLPSADSFYTQVVAGDTITVTQSGVGTQSATIIEINTDQEVTVNANATENFTAGSFTYSGYFVTPIYDSAPDETANIYYPGGSVLVTSDAGSSGTATVWGLATVAMPHNSYANDVGAGVLNAYTPGLDIQWSTNDAFNPTFALTVPQFSTTAGLCPPHSCCRR